jgi:hypothetical protein
MAYVLWAGAALLALWLVRTAMGLYAPFEFVGNAYLNKQLVRLGVSPQLLPQAARAAILSSINIYPIAYVGRIKQRSEFKRSLDIAALQFAQWLVDPSSTLVGELSSDKHPTEMRKFYGAPPALPAEVRSRILAQP